jgi:hypothetical protein
MADFEPLTVETSAAISAFIQELTIKAEGGKAVDEETLALRMLASTHADADYDYSKIQSINPSNERVTASADGDDKFAQLAALMMGDTEPPADQVAKGQVPKAPPIAILPGYNNVDVQTNYGTLMDATSMCQLYANLMQVQQKPEGFNITSEAGSAFNFQAKVGFDAMMGPMAGYYIFSSGSSQTYNNTIPRSDVHSALLGKIFDGFGFDKATHDSLDIQLTNFVAGLANIRSDNSPNNTFDFFLRLNLVPKRNVSGDDSDPVFIYQPTTYLVYMKMDANSFRQSTGKNSGVDKVTMKFTLTVTKCELNARKFEQNRAKFDKMFELVTGRNLKVYSELLNKQVKTDEPNPGGSK